MKMAKYKSPPSPCETCQHSNETQEWCNEHCTNEDLQAAGSVLGWMCRESDKEKEKSK